MCVRDFRSLRKTFVDLADTLAADFDILVFLELLCGYCADLLPDCACGVLLAGTASTPALATASAERVRALAVTELREEAGPGIESLRNGTVVSYPDLADAASVWPALVAAARADGYQAVDALPMRLREETIGALTLYRPRTGPLDADVAELALAIADVATIGIVHQRVLRHTEQLTRQLQSALDSRVIIEQAKGVLAERLHVAIDEAFLTLRRYARNNNVKLVDVARAVAEGSLDIEP